MPDHAGASRKGVIRPSAMQAFDLRLDRHMVDVEPLVEHVTQLGKHLIRISVTCQFTVAAQRDQS